MTHEIHFPIFFSTNVDLILHVNSDLHQLHTTRPEFILF